MWRSVKRCRCSFWQDPSLEFPPPLPLPQLLRLLVRPSHHLYLVFVISSNLISLSLLTVAGLLSPLQKRWATKKSGGSTRNGKDSPGQRLGVKKFSGNTLQHTHRHTCWHMEDFLHKILVANSFFHFHFH